MMNASKTSGFHLFKFVLLVPVIVLLLLAFRNRKEGRENIAVERPGAAEAFTLSKLTYSIPDNTVKNIVFKEESKSLLKTGEVFSLALVDKEKNRLRDLLEGNGYSNIYNGAITFLIDSSSANKSFSVQVNINVGARVVSTPAKRITSVNDGTNLLNHKSAESIKRVSYPESPAFNKRWELARINTFLNAGKTNQPSQA